LCRIEPHRNHFAGGDNYLDWNRFFVERKRFLQWV
jgi:hypothetical protein